MTRRAHWFAALTVSVFIFGAGPAAAQQAVDLALVLAVDASGSIDEGEFRLQKEGIVLAVSNQDVLAAVRAGVLRRIAIAYVEWGTPGAPHTAVGWSIIHDKESARAFASAVLAAPRSPQSYNAIGDAIDHGAALLKACPCKPARSVIDVSGDNRDINSLRPAPLARDAAVAAGITVNALAILQSDARGPSGKPLLIEAYEREVIGGSGAFALAARERSDFARALRQKMVLEIAGLPHRGGDLAAQPPPD